MLNSFLTSFQSSRVIKIIDVVAQIELIGQGRWQCEMELSPSVQWLNNILVSGA